MFLKQMMSTSLVLCLHVVQSFGIQYWQQQSSLRSNRDMLFYYVEQCKYCTSSVRVVKVSGFYMCMLSLSNLEHKLQTDVLLSYVHNFISMFSPALLFYYVNPYQGTKPFPLIISIDLTTQQPGFQSCSLNLQHFLEYYTLFFRTT